MNDYIGITVVTMIIVAIVTGGRQPAVAAAGCVIGLGLVFLGVSHSHEKHAHDHEPQIARMR
jgi:hypothetical protein